MFKAWSNEPDTALRKRRMLLWTIIGGGVAVLAAATVVVVSLLSQAGSGIPRVSDISASTSGDSIEFSWDDPGITEGDNYLVRVDNGTGVTQRSTSFVVDTSQSTGRVCVTVTVVRNGQNGEVSEAKCAEG